MANGPYIQSVPHTYGTSEQLIQLDTLAGRVVSGQQSVIAVSEHGQQLPPYQTSKTVHVCAKQNTHQGDVPVI